MPVEFTPPRIAVVIDKQTTTAALAQADARIFREGRWHVGEEYADLHTPHHPGAGARARFAAARPLQPRWIGSTHSTVSGFSTGSMSRLTAVASPSLRTRTHSSTSVGLALISWCGT